MTLPSRLKVPYEKQVTLPQLESFLNINGNQKIAYLQLSVLKPKFRDSRSPNYPTIMASDLRHTDGLDKGDTIPAGVTALDMNLSSTEIERSPRVPSPKIHTFGQVDVVRGTEVNTASVDSTQQLQQRLAGLPVVQRSKIRPLQKETKIATRLTRL
jgi:hypothetical protein